MEIAQLNSQYLQDGAISVKEYQRRIGLTDEQIEQIEEEKLVEMASSMPIPEFDLGDLDGDQ